MIGGGSLDRGEVEALLKKLGQTLTPAALDETMALMDPDGDGEVTEAEFTEWWAANKDKEGGLAASLSAFKETGELPPLEPRRANATPLHAACQQGRLNAVRLLVTRGASVEAATEDGWTPLHFAADGGDTLGTSHHFYIS